MLWHVVYRNIVVEVNNATLKMIGISKGSICSTRVLTITLDLIYITEFWGNKLLLIGWLSQFFVPSAWSILWWIWEPFHVDSLPSSDFFTHMWTDPSGASMVRRTIIDQCLDHIRAMVWQFLKICATRCLNWQKFSLESQES